jgi:hypothetical protein
LVEATTGLQAFRGFAGTSVLILVGVATDTARKFRAELAMAKYRCARLPPASRMGVPAAGARAACSGGRPLSSSAPGG